MTDITFKRGDYDGELTSTIKSGVSETISQLKGDYDEFDDWSVVLRLDSTPCVESISESAQQFEACWSPDHDHTYHYNAYESALAGVLGDTEPDTEPEPEQTESLLLDPTDLFSDPAVELYEAEIGGQSVHPDDAHSGYADKSDYWDGVVGSFDDGSGGEEDSGSESGTGTTQSDIERFQDFEAGDTFEFETEEGKNITATAPYDGWVPSGEGDLYEASAFFIHEEASAQSYVVRVYQKDGSNINYSDGSATVQSDKYTIKRRAMNVTTGIDDVESIEYIGNRETTSIPEDMEVPSEFEDFFDDSQSDDSGGQTPTVNEDKTQAKKDLSDVKYVGDKTAKQLVDAGITSRADLRESLESEGEAASIVPKFHHDKVLDQLGGESGSSDTGDQPSPDAVEKGAMVTWDEFDAGLVDREKAKVKGSFDNDGTTAYELDMGVFAITYKDGQWYALPSTGGEEPITGFEVVETAEEAEERRKQEKKERQQKKREERRSFNEHQESRSEFVDIFEKGDTVKVSTYATPLEVTSDPYNSSAKVNYRKASYQEVDTAAVDVSNPNGGEYTLHETLESVSTLVSGGLEIGETYIGGGGGSKVDSTTIEWVNEDDSGNSNSPDSGGGSGVDEGRSDSIVDVPVDSDLPEYDEIETEEGLIEYCETYSKLLVEQTDLEVDFSVAEWDTDTAKTRAGQVTSKKIRKAEKPKLIDWEKLAEKMEWASSVEYAKQVNFSFSWRAFEAWDEMQFRRTIRHEVIHAHENQKYGKSNHDSYFKRLADKYDTDVKCEKFVEEYRYEIYCTECGKMTSGRHRRSKKVKQIDRYISGCCEADLRVEENEDYDP